MKGDLISALFIAAGVAKLVYTIYKERNYQKPDTSTEALGTLYSYLIGFGLIVAGVSYIIFEHEFSMY